jgi:4-diphosphocytidyl-2-C-methyl-D-erythritol kinase
LKLLNEKFRLDFSIEQLINYASQLGSDGPFFIINTPCFATGRGEILEPVTIDLSAYKIVLINPGIHISTSWAFTQLQPAVPQRSIKEIIQQPVAAWKDSLHNDFENAVFTVHPEIKKIKETLYDLGAAYAAMSGSGSTVFGLFEKEVALDFPEGYFIRVV